jgi:signal peptidase I
MTAAMPTTDPEFISVSPDLLPLPRKARRPVRSILRQSWQFLAVGGMAVACYFFISHFLLQTVKVVGRSMVPSLYDSQHYLLNRWIYYVRPPRQSDIVVLRDPSDNGYSVKRVIAAPGDSIYLKDGAVYVNGCKLRETYLTPGTPTFTESKYHDQLILCGKGQYFVLGDNRTNSIDSRTYGPVPRQNILGPIVW